MANGNENENKNSDSKKKRKFLFVSWQSLSGDLAWQIQKEGNKVKIYISDDDDVYEGVLEKVKKWKEHIDWADVIVFDDIWFGEEADKLRKRGKLVVGGSEYTDKLEDDRKFGQEEMKKVGMNILPHWEFDDYDEGVKFIKDNPGRYIFKPSGDVSDWKSMLFIGREEDGKDLLEIIESNRKSLKKKVPQFQLQKFVSGIEIGAAAFFNGKEFVGPVNIAFEHKRLFPSELGPMTGEMGTSMFWTKPNYIFNNTLGLMKDKLTESGYVGYIDINCIVNGRGIYPLEFTSRFGYPTVSIQIEGIQSEWGEFLYAIAKGEQYDLKVKSGFQIGVVVATPPFPFYDKDEMNIHHNLSILFKKDSMDGIHLGDVKFEDGSWRVAGSTGYDLIVTGSGTTMEDARKQAYSRIDNIILQNMFYRTDIGGTWSEDSDKLRTWGYLD